MLLLRMRGLSDYPFHSFHFPLPPFVSSPTLTFPFLSLFCCQSSLPQLYFPPSPFPSLALILSFMLSLSSSLFFFLPFSPQTTPSCTANDPRPRSLLPSALILNLHAKSCSINLKRGRGEGKEGCRVGKGKEGDVMTGR